MNPSLKKTILAPLLALMALTFLPITQLYAQDADEDVVESDEEDYESDIPGGNGPPEIRVPTNAELAILRKPRMQIFIRSNAEDIIVEEKK